MLVWPFANGFGYALIIFCFIAQVIFTSYLQISNNNSLLTMSSRARKTACPFSAIPIDTFNF